MSATLLPQLLVFSRSATQLADALQFAPKERFASVRRGGCLRCSPLNFGLD